MNSYKLGIAESISPLLNLTPEEIIPLILNAPKNVTGDLSLPCFNFSKSLKKSPVVIAQELASQVAPPIFVTEVVPLNGYLNFCIDKTDFIKDVLLNVYTNKERYGLYEQNNLEPIVVDYSSPNMGKELAFHHLRGTMLGNSLCRIFKRCGHKVIRINHLGDWGTSYGKLIVMYLKQNLPPIEQYAPNITISFLNTLYKAFANESKDNPSLEVEAREAFEQLEKGNTEYLKMWEVFKEITLVELNSIYKLLQVEFDYYTGESFFVQKSDEVITNLKSKNLWQKSQGAEIVNLDKYELPPLMLKKSDGSSVYATRDLTAAIYRKKTFNFSKCYYVVDNGQSLHFEQLKHVLNEMEYSWYNDCIHIPYGLILNKNEDGKWEKGKTRAGQAKLLKEVLQAASDKILGIIEEKNFELENKIETSQKIAIGALVFNDLKHKRQHDVKFDWDSVLSFEGDTGPYVINAYVRLVSILRKKQERDTNFDKSSFNVSEIKFNLYKEIAEQELIESLSIFPERLLSACESLEPFLLAQYALSLADKSHSFIHACRVMGSPEENERLFLVACTAEVLRSALETLGMPVIEQM